MQDGTFNSEVVNDESLGNGVSELVILSGFPLIIMSVHVAV